MAARGTSIHGEMDFVERMIPDRTLTILDAGCGTGRLAIEAHRRGHRVVGVDLDPDMVDRARRKDPAIDWLCADLATVQLDESFDVVVMAGNIPLFCAAGSQAAIIANLEQYVANDGVLICGFSIEKGRDAYTAENFRRDAVKAGLSEIDQFSTWDGDRADASGSDDYAVFVCRRPLSVA